MRGRVTAAFYKQMGLNELIASDAETYLTLAQRLAQDTDFRGQVQADIKANNHKLYERQEAVREMESLLLLVEKQMTTSTSVVAHLSGKDQRLLESLGYAAGVGQPDAPDEDTRALDEQQRFQRQLARHSQAGAGGCDEDGTLAEYGRGGAGGTVAESRRHHPRRDAGQALVAAGWQPRSPRFSTKRSSSSSKWSAPPKASSSTGGAPTSRHEKILQLQKTISTAQAQMQTLFQQMQELERSNQELIAKLERLRTGDERDTARGQAAVQKELCANNVKIQELRAQAGSLLEEMQAQSLMVAGVEDDASSVDEQEWATAVMRSRSAAEERERERARQQQGGGRTEEPFPNSVSLIEADSPLSDLNAASELQEQQELAKHTFSSGAAAQVQAWLDADEPTATASVPEPDGRQYGPAIFRVHYEGHDYQPHM